MVGRVPVAGDIVNTVRDIKDAFKEEFPNMDVRVGEQTSSWYLTPVTPADRKTQVLSDVMTGRRVSHKLVPVPP